jgi:hypothetical protein
MANFNGRARANEITAGLKLYPKIEYCVRPQPKGTNVWQNYYFFDWLNHLPRNNNLCKDSIKFNKMLASHKKIKPYLVSVNERRMCMYSACNVC